MITEHEIHVWFAYDKSICAPNLLSRYHMILSDDERIQLSRFHFEKDRHQYLITRIMIRTVLSHYVKSIKPEQWTFKKNEYGKPSISNHSITIPLRFNISHSDKIIAIAVILGKDIGIDVEYLPRIGNMLPIANRFFSPVEVKQLFELPLKLQVKRFLDLWTLKEAYIKACGMGLSIPLNHFSYTFSSKGEIQIDFASERNDQPEYWKFWQIQPTEIHKVSIALKDRNRAGSYFVLMRKIIPLSMICDVNYPAAHGRIITL